MNLSKLTLSLRLTSTGKVLDRYGVEKETTETLCDIEEQHLSKSMMGAALRALADEIDPRMSAERKPF